MANTLLLDDNPRGFDLDVQGLEQSDYIVEVQMPDQDWGGGDFVGRVGDAFEVAPASTAKLQRVGKVQRADQGRIVVGLHGEVTQAGTGDQLPRLIRSLNSVARWAASAGRHIGRAYSLQAG